MYFYLGVLLNFVWWRVLLVARRDTGHSVPIADIVVFYCKKLKIHVSGGT